MSDFQLWSIILSLGVGSFLLRFSFLGFIGSRRMPDWLLRHLRYTAVAVLPALVAPLVVFTDGPGSAVEPGQILAGIATLVTGWWTRNVFAGLGAGVVTLTIATILFGG